MSDPLPSRIELGAGTAALIKRSGGWTPAICRAIGRGLNRENELTIGYAQRVKMSQRGPTTLGVITNRLRSSLTRIPAKTEGTQIESGIATNVAYAKPHEEGLDEIVQVKAHTRKLTRTEQSVVAVLTKSGHIRKRKRTRSELIGEVVVRAHRMHMRMPKRSFIRSSIAERRENYGTTLRENVIGALQGKGEAK